MKFLIAIFFILLFNISAFAETEVIEFPEEELATESVLPKFDRTVAVKNKFIEFSKRYELGGYFGLALNEPFFNTNKVGLSGTYHLSEDGGINVMYSHWLGGVSSYSKQLEDEFGLDFSRAPAPKGLLLASYELKAYYGKMSLSKKVTTHLSLYGLFGLGMAIFENKSYPALNLGLGQKFFFTKNLAARFDLRLVMHNAPVPTSAPDKGLRTNRPVPEKSEFDDSLTYNTNLDIGLIYLF